MITLPAFSVIGKEGSSIDDPMIAKTLWTEANTHFSEIGHLAKKNDHGSIGHTRGLMSDLGRNLKPWRMVLQKDCILPEWRPSRKLLRPKDG